MRLVFSNAIDYNGEDSDVADCAVALLKFFETSYSKIVEEEHPGLLPPGERSRRPNNVPPGLSGAELPQRDLSNCAIINERGNIVSIEEAVVSGDAPPSRLVGRLIRPGFEQRPETNSVIVAVPIQELFLEYYPEHDDSTCYVWMRGERAWYRLLEPHEGWSQEYKASVARMKIEEMIRMYLLKNSKAGYEKMLQVCGFCMSGVCVIFFFTVFCTDVNVCIFWEMLFVLLVCVCVSVCVYMYIYAHIYM